MDLKTVSNILALLPFVERCKKFAYKIVLFGSRAEGTHSHDSDFDIMVVGDSNDEIMKALSKVKFRIQLFIKSLAEFIRMSESEPALAAAITKGITLWEKK
jgi:predicted nucleotidyltransferase